MVDIKCLITQGDSYTGLFTESKFSLNNCFSVVRVRYWSLLVIKKLIFSHDLTQIRNFSRINTTNSLPSTPPETLNFTSRTSIPLIFNVRDQTFQFLEIFSGDNLIAITFSEKKKYAIWCICLLQWDDIDFSNVQLCCVYQASCCLYIYLSTSRKVGTCRSSYINISIKRKFLQRIQLQNKRNAALRNWRLNSYQKDPVRTKLTI